MTPGDSTVNRVQLFTPIPKKYLGLQCMQSSSRDVLCVCVWSDTREVCSYRQLVLQKMEELYGASFRDDTELNQATSFLHENGVSFIICLQWHSRGRFNLRNVTKQQHLQYTDIVSSSPVWCPLSLVSLAEYENSFLLFSICKWTVSCVLK